MENKKLIVVDGNSLLFRAFYATAFPGAPIMRTSTGIPTNAIFAFSNMINKIINEQKEEFNMFVSFDTGKKTFRHEELESYKANRKPTPQELIDQMPLARELLRHMGVYIYEQEGLEGDDLAGTIAKQGSKKGYTVQIYTSDKDFLQL
ncbi:MAG: DNA polymerase I, partial [Bacilli bacterium]|nr:DNA polymerase I [Bacilli bacterium]